MVIYDGKKIIPAPFASFRRIPQTTGDGRTVGVVYQITVQGTLVAYKGSPNSSGTFHTASGYPADETLDVDEMHKALLRKQDALQKLFANEGRTLEFQPWDSSSPLKCNPRVGPIDFQEGQWFNTLRYSVTFEADTLEINGVVDSGDANDYKVSSTSEDWAIEALNEDLGTYRLSRNVSATGKRFYNSSGNLVQEAWENAKDYVLNRLELGLKPARMEAADVLDTGATAYNYLRSQNIDETGGVFSVTETWVCFDPDGEPPAYEEWSVDTRTNLSGRSNVTISGNITGLEVRDNNTRELTSTKWTNASNKWENYVKSNLHTRAQNTSGITLHTSPLSTSVGKNEVSGSVTYSYEYDNRGDTYIVGAVTSSLSVSNENAADRFTTIGIPERIVGPLLQDLQTKTEKSRSVTLEAQMPARTQSSAPTMPSAAAATVILTWMPGNQGETVTDGPYVSSDRENFDIDEGAYSRTIVYTWT